MSPTIEKTWVTVWDPYVRYGHWALVAMFAVAYLSGEDEGGGPDQLHIWTGYAVGITVALRIVWGFIGTQHARFTDFACRPETALRYLADMMRGRARRHLGHSPIAAAMIAALLVCLTGTVWTGIAANDRDVKGPVANAASLMTTPAHAERDESRNAGREESGDKGGDSAVGELHSALANITLGLIILHVLGVGLSSVMHRENLVLAMITGKKRRDDEA